MKTKFVVYLIFLYSLAACGVSESVRYVPDVSSYPIEIPTVVNSTDSTFHYKDNFLTRNRQRLYELYVHGNALQLGYNNGALTQPLLQRQEQVFFSKIETLVPSKFKQKLIRAILKFYNRKMHLNVREDFQAELYGISQYSSDDYDFIAPKFQRSLYLHAAHDIGHALQDFMIVGCSSLAVWDEHSVDGSLLIGRNFDFYVGDDFAKQKLVSFVEPEQGIPFMSVSWPGMIGVASGMNRAGLTVTINAGKSKIPLAAKTPISLLTREILQFASTIDEAIAIAKKRKVFVSESILVGSAKDHKAVIIEVAPDNFGVYESSNSGRLICTNHFQSEPYQKDARNTKHIQESHSQYRYQKLNDFISEKQQLDPLAISKMLRDRSGIKAASIGNGNEKSVNQLIAHHAVIFAPEKGLAWVSSDPYNLGAMVCYDLNAIFSLKRKIGPQGRDELNIPKDTFAESVEFKNYEKYRIADRTIDEAIQKEEVLSDSWLENYQSLNPDLWMVYFKRGRYYYENRQFAAARREFEKALSKEIPSVPERENIEKLLRKSTRKPSLKF